MDDKQFCGSGLGTGDDETLLVDVLNVSKCKGLAVLAKIIGFERLYLIF